MGSFSDAVKAVDEARRIVAQVFEAKDQLSAAELKLALADVKSLLADARVELAATRELLLEKDIEIDRMKKAIEFKENLTKVDGFKYDTVDGSAAGFPYCPKCEVKFSQYYRIIESPKGRICPNCLVDYGKGAMKLHRPRTVEVPRD